MKSRILDGFKCLVLMSLFVLTLSGCQKWSHNGDIDGQWQVLSVNDSGVEVQFPDDEIYYYNFYLHTFQLTYTGKRSIQMTGNMTYSKGDDKIGLVLGFVAEGNVSQYLMDRLVYWGMPKSGEVVMDVKELTSSRLIMEHNGVVITCRKF